MSTSPNRMLGNPEYRKTYEAAQKMTQEELSAAFDKAVAEKKIFSPHFFALRDVAWERTERDAMSALEQFHKAFG